MAARTIPPWLRQTLELGPVIGFFALFMYVRDDTFTVAGTEYDGLIFATAIFIPVILASTAILWLLTGKLSRMQVFTAVAVTFFGGLSVWLNDERFVKIRPTLVYGLFAAILWGGLWFGKSLLRSVMGEILPMKPEGWMILTRRMAWLFVVMAVSNEVVWRTLSTEVWVTFETFVLPGMMFAFFIAQARLIEAYSEDPVEPDDAG
ncbi:MAG: inner membrane-spanning protein YciB [Pseudomonadota bacterium]